jgi:hypothetical protein
MITPQTYHTEAELFIRSHAHGPFEFGTVIKPDMPAWEEWLRYFARKGLEVQRSFMRSRWANGYVVPCLNPEDFDPSSRPASRTEPMSQRATPAGPRRETRMYSNP